MRYFQSTTVDKVGGETIMVDMVRTIEYNLGDDMTIETNYIIHPPVVKIMEFPPLKGDREENLPPNYSEKSTVDDELMWEEISKGDFEDLIRGLKQYHYIYKED